MSHVGPVVTTVALMVMLVGGCAGFKRFAYEGFRRDRWQQPQRVIEALGIRPGQQIVDLGAGGGYFTFRLAAATGTSGKVYAVDIDPDMIAYLQQRAVSDGVRNVEVIEATPDDPHLPERAVDLIFTSNTYHHISERTAYFAHAKCSLKPDGRVAIIDSKRVGLFHRLFGHWTASTRIRSEMEAAGYRLEREYDFLPSQNFLVFSRADD